MILHRLEAAGFRRLAIVVVVIDLLIVAGVGVHLAGGTAVGTALTANGGVDPIALLGTVLGDTTCPTAPLAVGDGATAICSDFSAITSGDGTVEVVSLYGPGNAVIDQYRGELPMAMRWGDSLTEVAAALGRPARITDVYGTPTLVYVYEDRAYGSLELRFNSGDRLMRVNACLLR